MINTKDKVVPSVEEREEREMEEEEEDDEEEDDSENEEEDSSDDDDDDEEGEHEKEAESSSQDANENASSSDGEKKEPSDGLNLNNEVVKMRTEVKRVKALVIRKLTRQIAMLKKKKGNEAETERNQRRAARLLEEVHSIKKLPPDVVTKTALQTKLNFEEVCKNPESKMSDRAVARIATHPQFSKKIESIKAAIEEFKEEHKKARKQGGQSKSQRQTEKSTQPPPDNRLDRKSKEKIKDGADKKEKDAPQSEKDEKVSQLPATLDVPKQEKPKSTSVKSASVKGSMTPKPQTKVQERGSRLQAAPELIHKSPEEEEESNVESSGDEEKEYFDDSTEERFHKLSSQSEESEEDDFFIGKVSKFKKKKKKQTSGDGTEKEEERPKDPGSVKTDKLQGELDELESRLKSQRSTVQSVFCSSLAGGKGGGAKAAPQGNFRAGRGGGFSKLNKFPKQENRTFNSRSKFSKPVVRGPHSESNRTDSGPAGRGRSKDVRQQTERRGGFVSRQPPQPALHPSWEASKKRKEQQGQILAFQGKKIKFDDDD
ncbi:PREDICTED: serum response factor-binding protein 1 [Cyprinodon variegatus]|uniref:serum response factor-binding protein 1 n=1 Tax=Cyprinodon variegatus TaxID=28743 RepID=UPI0007424D58|nr:PREDICTED: serum response factor-binding protein 1 [Cyprinodon variegatus]